MNELIELELQALKAKEKLQSFGVRPMKRSCLWSAANLNVQLTSEELQRAKQRKEPSENNAG